MVVYQINSMKKGSMFEGISLTTRLIFLNVFLYLVLLIIEPAFSKVECVETICKYIAISPFNILNNFYLWTFFTSMFMHGGIFHLFVNMLSLFFVGNLLEKILGKKRFLSFYLISGILAGLLFVLSAFIYPEYMGIFAVGASGALFGLIGILIFLTPNLPVYMMFIPIPIKMKYAAPGMLIVLWVISEIWKVPLGNIAHLGGLLSGVVYGIYLKKKFPNKTEAISRRFS